MSKLGEAVTIVFSDFTKGMTTQQPVHDMDRRFSMRMQNCYVTEKGTIGKVVGYEKLHQDALPTAINDGVEYIRSDGSKEIIVGGGGRLYSFDPDTWVWTQIYIGMDINATIAFAQFADLIIIVNGVDTPLKYDGITVTTLGGSPPIASALYVFKNRLWMNNVDDVMVAHHSGLQDPEDWTSPNNSGYIDFDFVLPQGDELLGFGAYSAYHVFFFKAHVALYVGDTPTSEGNYALAQIIPNIGVTNDHAQINIANDLFFATAQGIKSLRLAQVVGALNVNNISEEIDQALVPAINILLQDPSKRILMSYYPAGNFLICTIGDSNWVYDYVRKTWFLTKITQFSGTFNDNRGNLYFCGDAGYLMQLGKGWSFAGESVEMWWMSAWMRPKKAGRIFSKLAEIRVHGRRQKFTFRVRYDGGRVHEESTIDMQDLYPSVNMDAYNQGDWDDTLQMDQSQWQVVRIPLCGAGNLIQFSIYCDSTEGPLEFAEITLQAKVGSL